MSSLDEQRLWELFHKLWARSVTPGYNKEDWMELERLILLLISENKK